MRYLICSLVVVFAMIAVSQPVYSANVLMAETDSQLPAYGTILSSAGETIEWTLEFARIGRQIGHTVMVVRIGEMMEIIDSEDYAISGTPYVLGGFLTGSADSKSQQLSVEVRPGSTAGHFKNIKISTR